MTIWAMKWRGPTVRRFSRARAAALGSVLLVFTSDASTLALGSDEVPAQEAPSQPVDAATKKLFHHGKVGSIISHEFSFLYVLKYSFAIVR